jgi:hypothetical protein
MDMIPGTATPLYAGRFSFLCFMHIIRFLFEFLLWLVTVYLFVWHLLVTCDRDRSPHQKILNVILYTTALSSII